MNPIKPTVSLAALVVALCLPAADADTLLRWDFLNDTQPNGAAPTSVPDLTAPNISPAVLSRGTRATPDNVYVGGGKGAFSTNSGDQDADLASALANGSYFRVTVAPQSGSTLSLSGMDIATFTQNENASFTFEVVFSTDGFATHTSVGVINPVSDNFTGTLTTLNLAGFPALQNTASSIEFRAAYYGTDVGYQSRGLGQISGTNDDLAFYGSVVSSLPLTVTTNTLPNGTNGLSYTQSLSATGGTSPVTWTVNSGALPAGLSLTPEGIIEGFPTTNGTSNFTVLATDSALPTAATDTQALSITIVAPPPPTITTTSVANTTTGANYSQTLSNIDGTGPFTWSLTSGSLPDGLSLTAEGVIEGVPSTTGTSTFTVTVTDSATPVAGTDSQVLTITVSETLVAWDFFNDVAINGDAVTAVPDTLNSNLQSPVLSRGGDGFSAANVTFNGGRGAFSTNSNSVGDLAAALAQGAYASVTLAPQAGFKFSLTSVDLALFTQDADNLTFDVVFSTDGFASYTSAGVINPINAGWTGMNRSVNLNAFPELQNVTAPAGVEIRIAFYGGGAYNQRGFGQIVGANNDIAFNGSIAPTGPASNYAAWAASNGVTGGKYGDSDSDGIVNLVEYALQTNLTGSDGSLGIFNGTTLSFAKRGVAAFNGDVTYAIESSPTLGAAPSPWMTVAPTVNSSSTISYMFPPGPPVGFSRLKVTSP